MSDKLAPFVLGAVVPLCPDQGDLWPVTAKLHACVKRQIYGREEKATSDLQNENPVLHGQRWSMRAEVVYAGRGQDLGVEGDFFLRVIYGRKEEEAGCRAVVQQSLQ